jgi:hypothetical protein
MDLEERGLDEIVEILAIDVTQPREDAVDLDAVPEEELLERASVTGDTRHHQRLVGEVALLEAPKGENVFTHGVYWHATAALT